MEMELPPATDYYPHIAYDSVIFGFSGNTLKILVMEYKRTGLYALPGGFVKKDENLDDAVKRGLHDRTGLKDIYLEQFHTFGAADRSDPGFMKRILEGSPVQVFEPPEGVVFAKIDAETGLLPIPESKQTLFECFKEGTVPTERTPKPDVISEPDQFFKSLM